MVEKRILVVEDESIVAEDIRVSLEDLGYIVPDVVSSGEAAIGKVEETVPDLILMDIMLKGEMDGIETADRIHSSFNIPVVFLTAYGDEKTLERAKVTEPYGYIIKPFKQRELHINIEIALYKYEMEKKLKWSNEWLSTILRSIGDAVIATDTKDKVMFMNPVAQYLTGWKIRDAREKPLNDVYRITTEKTDTDTESPVVKVKGDGVVVGQANQTTLISRDGRHTPIEDTSDPIKDEKGNVIGSVLIFRDISERREAEQEIINFKEFYKSVLDSIVDWIWVTDKNDAVCFVNKSMREMKQISGALSAFSDHTTGAFGSNYIKAKETLQPVYYKDTLSFVSEGQEQSGWLIPRIRDGTYDGMICTVRGVEKRTV